MSERPKRLRGLKVKRIDLVDKGAAYDELSGEGAHVLLFKRDGGETDVELENLDEDLMDKLAEALEKGKRKKLGGGAAPSAGGQNCPSCGKPAGANSAYCPNCGKNLGQLFGPPSASGQTQKGAGMSKKEFAKATKKALKKLAKKEQEKEILRAAKASAKGDPEPAKTTKTITRKAADGKVETIEETVIKARPKTDEEDAYKGVPESVRKKIEEAEKRASRAEEKVTKLVEEQAKAAFAKVAKGYGLPGAKTDELGEVLRKAAEVLSESEYATLSQVLKSSAALVKESAVFGERGTTGGTHSAPGSASEELEKRALALVDERVKKGAEALTLADAMNEVFAADPALYARYRREVSIGGGRSDREEA